MMSLIFSNRVPKGIQDYALLVLRVGVGIFMLNHGYPKLHKLMLGGEINFADPFYLGPTISLVLAVFAEFICSIFIIVGFATRLSAIPLIVTMLTAAFVIHAEDGFFDKELSMIYLLIYICILLLGPGKISIDYFSSRKFS